METSVRMATCNGETCVVRQLRSILNQLAPDDEIMPVDDCSTDGPVDVVRNVNDSRIAIHVNEPNIRG